MKQKKKPLSKSVRSAASPAELYIIERFTRRTSDNKGACLVVGVQSFDVGPPSNNVHHIDWMRWMIAKAVLHLLTVSAFDPELRQIVAPTLDVDRLASPRRGGVFRWIWTYINHAALNAGALLACVWFALVPPQCTGHSRKDLESLGNSSPWRAFWEGLTR